MKQLLPRRAQFVVWAVVAFFVGALLLACALLIGVNKRSALEEAEHQLARYVSVTGAELNRAFLGVDVLLAGAGESLIEDNASAQWLNRDEASSMLMRLSRSNLNVRLLAVVDRNGKVVASSDPRGGQLALHLPDGFVEKALAPMVATVVFSAPVQSFASSERVVFLARTLRKANGPQLVAVAELPIATLASVLAQDSQTSGLEVAIETSGGGRMLTMPTVGDDSPAPSPLIGVSPATVWSTPSRLSGAPGLVMVRPLIYEHLWISASLPERSALVTWRKEARVVAAVAFVFALLGLTVGYMFTEYLRRMTGARQALSNSKAQLDQALEAMTSGFVLLDNKHRVLHWNQRFDEIFPWLAGFMAPNLPFRKMLDATVLRHLPHASASARKNWVDRRLAMQTIADREHDQVLPNGRTLRITEHRTPDGGMVITYTDITEMRRARDEIETLAFYDPLTGLPNRRLLLDRLGQATERAHRSGGFGALLFMDLDQFKAINDSLGHDVGDVLLQEVAKRLKQSVREADTVARLGGDEFVIMLTDLSTSALEAASQAHSLSKKLLENLSGPYQLQGQGYQSTVSVGATLFGHAPQSAADLLRQADIAMYHVKARHGNGLCFFDAQMQTAISNRVQLDADLRQALRNGEFVLHYQAQFSDTGGIFGAEALLRWQHPQRGLLLPEAFIAAAEESGIIVDIGGWVLRAACLQLAVWQKDPRCMNLQLSINVSTRQFRHFGFVSQMLDEVACLGSRAHLLTLELTESLVIDDIEETVRRMHQLRERGIRFAVDDFGTGYSSLAYLTRLPLHQLKIDQSFVRNLGSRPSDDVIVQTIIGMAHNLELEVIAEGVETEDQLRLLRGYGCSSFQGYLLANPMPVAELFALLPEPGLGVLSV